MCNVGSLTDFCEDTNVKNSKALSLHKYFFIKQWSSNVGVEHINILSGRDEIFKRGRRKGLVCGYWGFFP